MEEIVYDYEPFLYGLSDEERQILEPIMVKIVETFEEKPDAYQLSVKKVTLPTARYVFTINNKKEFNWWSYLLHMNKALVNLNPDFLQIKVETIHEIAKKYLKNAL